MMRCGSLLVREPVTGLTGASQADPKAVARHATTRWVEPIARRQLKPGDVNLGSSTRGIDLRASLGRYRRSRAVRRSCHMARLAPTLPGAEGGCASSSHRSTGRPLAPNAALALFRGRSGAACKFGGHVRFHRYRSTEHKFGPERCSRMLDTLTSSTAWIIIDVIAVAIFATALAYGSWQWRQRRRQYPPGTKERAPGPAPKESR
jgi:hypothetical protein